MSSGTNPLTGYAGQARGLHFDGDVDKYERWECKFLAHMRIKNLKKVFLPGELASADKREEAFAELAHFIDDRSLQLVMRDAKDDGKKSIKILRDHYLGTSAPRILSLYTVSAQIQNP